MRTHLRVLAIGAAAAAAAAMIVLVVRPAAAETNTIANPGFESGLSPWSCPNTASAVTGHAHTGNYALRGAVTDADNARCTQTVTVAANTRYTLSAYVNGAYVRLGVSSTGGAETSTWTPGTNGAYQQLSVSFTTGANTSSVTIYIHGWYAQGTYHADDVTMPGPDSGTPTPTGAPSPTPTATSSPAPDPTTSPTPGPTASPTGPPTPSASASTGPPVNLPECRHFSDVAPPDRPSGPNRDAVSQGPRIDLSGRLPAPGNVTGSLSAGAVTITFDRVPGAKAYRLWRNGQSVAWVEDWGQAKLTATDRAPCRLAHYTVVALRSDASEASTGQLSAPYRLDDDGTVRPHRLAPGTRMTFKTTSYDDPGQTASGYGAGLGICAVDPRIIPLGTRFKVDGYGYCYAADMGTWIQGDIVDVWLPGGGEANAWGVQDRTITIE